MGEVAKTRGLGIRGGMADKNDIDAIRDFIKKVGRKHAAGGATEHSYRPYLIELIETLDNKIDALNEAKRIGGNAPDITMKRDGIAVGYLEAKDIDVPIRSSKGANKEQRDRYKKDLPNLVYTNNLDWNFYRNGDFVHSVSIAALKRKKIVSKPENFAELADYLQDVLNQSPQTIKTAEELAKHMASKTLIIRNAFLKKLTGKDPQESLEKQYKTLVKQLIRRLKKPEFADMYAQTITYGLFVARLNSTPETFNREKLQELVPENYSFLKDLFEFIAAKTLGETLELYIDDLIEIYRATDDGIMKNYEEGRDGKDPFLHFYEDFLKAYNPAERKTSGVYYTPEPVVDFIVRGVDWVLKKEFKLPHGLANSEKTKVPWKIDEAGKLKHRDVHKVQILDPATGTGTFLAHTIRHIAKIKQKSGRANWSSYVNNDLLPRLHGFEIMMAPYIMCYLKLNMLLSKLGYTAPPKNPERMSIYLTDSLTSSNQTANDFGFNNHWLEQEAEGATKIKDKLPIMCVIGNPPYNSKSKNDSKWIDKLIKDYKKEPNTENKLDEENIQSLSDDYVKFIRLAQYMVEKNGEGVVGMITGHGYLDNATFRGMRWNLMNSFDGIYILDLHGNARRHEIAPNGKPDRNVFDIMQGVSIIIAWRKKHANIKNKPLAKIFRGDLLGTREEKFDKLSTEDLDSKRFTLIKPREPYYLFTMQNYDLLEEYGKGFKITSFMPKKSTGIKTHRDKFVFDIDEEKLIDRIELFYDRTKNDKEIKETLNLKDNRDWSVTDAREKGNFDDSHIKPCAYRPFDTRPLYYDPDLIDFDRRNVMRNFLLGENVGLVLCRQQKDPIGFFHALVNDTIIESTYLSNKTCEISYCLPLYIDPRKMNEPKQTKMEWESDRIVNMDETIRKAIEDIATDSKNGKPEEYAIFDYIYGLLHAPEYRTRYAEFLKTDFPRIPYPKDSAEFWHLSSVGTKLRKLHLMPKDIDISAHTFGGENTTPIVESPHFDNEGNGRVWINKSQFFDNVPESVWNFYIGGYQPARKWLKDRKGQQLDDQTTEHYQRIIAVLVQTKTTMDDIKWSRP